MGLLNKDGTLNKANYDKKLKKQQETFAQIDAAMSILEKLPDLSDAVLDMLDTDSLSLSLSPMGFLFNILRSLGVSEETLREWIIEILIYALPAVEVGLKASLLANLKSLVSCNSDARIPFYMRKKVGPTFTDIMSLSGVDNRGLIIPISSIDPEGMLDLSPFTAPGSTRYFGCIPDSRLDYTLRSVIEKIGLYEEETKDGGWLNEVSSTGASSAQLAKLARADDFNAFLWYAIHKGNKMSPFDLTSKEMGLTTDGKFKYNDKEYSLHNINGSSKSTLGGYTILKCKDHDGPGSEFSAGSTFCMGNNGNISILIKSKSEYEQILVDISSDWFSCNWYVNKSNYVSNTGISKPKERNYEKEHGICNIKHYKETDLAGRAIKGAPECIQFTILPKPYIFIPTVAKAPDGKIAVVSQVKRLLFDADGTPNPKGRYSFDSEGQTFENARHVYDVSDEVRNEVVRNDTVGYEINLKTGQYKLTDISKANQLVECYPGLTVYEFNYDFVMGMKLFDPKVVCQRILENASNANYSADINFGWSFNKLKDKNTASYSFVGEKQRLVEVVRQIIEEDEEINDCFFTFSNEQYEKMLDATEELRYGKMPFDNGYSDDSGIDMSEVTNILSAYPENGTLEEQKYVLNKALEAATGIFNNIGSGGIESASSSNSSSTNKKKSGLKLNSNLGTDFLLNALESMVMAIVDAMLSPKVLLLLAVNQALMSGDSDKPITAKDLMSAMQNIVKSLVREVRDMIMEKILDYIIKTLTPIALQIQALIVSEQLQAYLQIIKLLLSWFNKGMQVANGLGSALSSMLSSFKSRFGDSFDGIDDVNSAYSGLANMDLPTVLDDIQYADIDLNDISESTPIIENC